jgi:hypothetical protein
MRTIEKSPRISNTFLVRQRISFRIDSYVRQRGRRIRSPKMLLRKASLDHEKCYPKVQWRLYGHASETSINTFCIASIPKGKQRGEKANS